MNINYKEPQFELFPANSATLEDINKPRFLLATLTLSTENIVILAILGIMIAVFSFSLGVEMGKHRAAQDLDEKASAAWNVGGRRLASPAVAVSPLPAVGSSPATVKPSTKPLIKPVVISPASITQVRPANAVPVAHRWTVQLSTYKNENYAKQEALGLKGKGLQAFLIKSKDFYLVCVGQFGSQEQADAFNKKIQAKYQGSQVRRF